MLDCEKIKTVFEQQFRYSHNIVLIGGAEEPVYVPATDINRLYYTRDYPASALHEIAHWCLASPEQLTQKDWGHWYTPDGRTAEQQKVFQRVEARVQAIEWILSVAAGRPFRESTDNLSGEMTDDAPFKDAIHEQVLNFLQKGLPKTVVQLCDALMLENGKPVIFSPALFRREALG